MKILYLSPSTQEKNLSTDNINEEGNMNRLANGIARRLVKVPITIYRNSPSWDATASIADSNRKRSDLHLALHSNAGGGSGVIVFYDPTKQKTKALAERLAASISKVLGVENDGIKDGRHLIEISKADKNVNPMLIETHFHDNATDVAKFNEKWDAVANEISYLVKVFFAEV